MVVPGVAESARPVGFSASEIFLVDRQRINPWSPKGLVYNSKVKEARVTPWPLRREPPAIERMQRLAKGERTFFRCEVYHRRATTRTRNASAPEL